MPRVIIFIALFHMILQADTINTRDGGYIYNCEVVKQDSEEIEIRVYHSDSSKVIILPKFLIKNIEKGEVNINENSKVNIPYFNINNRTLFGEILIKQYEYKFNYKSLPVTLMAFFIAYDYNKEIKYVQKQKKLSLNSFNDLTDITLDMYKNLNYNIDEDKIKAQIEDNVNKIYKEQIKQLRKRVIIFSAIGILNLIINTEKVNLNYSTDGIEISLNL